MTSDEPLTTDDVTVTESTVVEHMPARREPEFHVVIHTEDHGAFAGNDLEEELGARAVYDDESRAQRQANGLAA